MNPRAMDSLDIVEALMALEETLGIEIPDEDAEKITTVQQAIDYVNSRPHLGTAYEKITADVIARDRRLRGFDVRFVMGNDEHSQNVYKKARELGMEPLAYCDQMEREFRDVWRRLDISFDDFIRTTEARHRIATTTLAKKIQDAGDIYEGFYEGWYCVSCEAFKHSDGRRWTGSGPNRRPGCRRSLWPNREAWRAC